MQPILERAEQLADKGEGFAEKVGTYMVDGFQYLALFVIGTTIVMAGLSVISCCSFAISSSSSSIR